MVVVKHTVDPLAMLNSVSLQAQRRLIPWLDSLVINFHLARAVPASEPYAAAYESDLSRERKMEPHSRLQRFDTISDAVTAIMRETGAKIYLYTYSTENDVLLI